MELIILAGLALFILFAATAEGGEAEVETIIITRPVPRAQRRPLFPTVVIILIIGLLMVLVVGRLATIAG